MTWLLEHSIFRRGLTATVWMLMLQTILFTGCYVLAWRHLRAHDPRRVENLRSVSYYARPKLLFVGQEMKRDELAAYLESLSRAASLRTP